MKTRLCKKLNHEASIDQFNTNIKTGKVHPWCKSCVKDYDHKRHKNQATKIRAQKKSRRQEIRQWIIELKSTLKCNRCPESYFACLTFHHTDPTKKDIAISDAVKGGWSKKNILAEIAKCEVLCSNCHLKHHFGN
jgi:hypothetical protein